MRPQRGPIFALVDCDCFYVSCQRLFEPRLERLPVIVLSNNDGCTISRSDEAKAIGIKMGAPQHLIKELIKEHNVQVFSSNYALYGDLSARVVDVLSAFSPDVEVYSIDESFLRLDGFPGSSLTDYGRSIRTRVKQDLGLPTCVGIGATKVIAKLANRMAKKNKVAFGGVLDLTDPNELEIALEDFPVEDIWGIGAKSAEKLHAVGIRTAREFIGADPERIQRLLTIVGSKIQAELKGFSCLPLEMVRPDKKQIISSRSFGRPVFKLNELRESVAQYVTRASEKLRRQGSTCHCISVFVHTNPFKQIQQYYQSASLKLPTGTNSTTRLCEAAYQILGRIFKEGIEYKKAGVILTDLRSSSSVQFSLFDDRAQYQTDRKVTALMDRINAEMGRDTLKIAACGTDQGWKMVSKLCSPNFTTRWDDLPKFS